jgi:predicted alpha/beta-hydrolase family hydrolase
MCSFVVVLKAVSAGVSDLCRLINIKPWRMCCGASTIRSRARVSRYEVRFFRNRRTILRSCLRRSRRLSRKAKSHLGHVEEEGIRGVVTAGGAKLGADGVEIHA